MQVVVVHDYVTQRGGAERVALDLLRAFPGSRLVTSCFEPGATFPEFADHQVETLWTDRFAAFRRDPRRAFPFLAAAFGSHLVEDADVVICSSSGWAHRVRTEAPKIVYCHNPARWFYQPEDYFGPTPPTLQRAFLGATRSLQRSDLRASREASVYAVNSAAVADRVRSAYHLDPLVMAPARGVSPAGPQRPVPGVAPGFLLTVGRARGYKHTDVVTAAMSHLPEEHLVVVGGDTGQLAHNVLGCGRVDDAQLRWLYAHAAGLVAMSHEDFGLTPVEAQAFGVPSVLLREGGYLESSVEGLTCVFVDDLDPRAVAAGIVELRRTTWEPSAIRRHGEHYSPAAFAARMQSMVEWVLAGRPAAGVADPIAWTRHTSA